MIEKKEILLDCLVFSLKMNAPYKLDLIAILQSSKTVQKWLLFVSSFGLYFNTLRGDLVFDDAEAIRNNADVTSAWNSLEFLRNDFWGDPIRSNFSHKSYRPLTVLTFR